MLEHARRDYDEMRKQVLKDIQDQMLYEISENYRIPERVRETLTQTSKRTYSIGNTVFLRHEAAMDYYMRRILRYKTKDDKACMEIDPILKVLLKIAEVYMLPMRIKGGPNVSVMYNNGGRIYKKLNNCGIRGGLSLEINNTTISDLAEAARELCTLEERKTIADCINEQNTGALTIILPTICVMPTDLYRGLGLVSVETMPEYDRYLKKEIELDLNEEAIIKYFMEG